MSVHTPMRKPSCGQYCSHKKHARFMEEDGRPQGAPPLHSTSPVPTIYEQNQPRHIVGTGAVWMWGVAPCGRPSSPGASRYVKSIVRCGRPSSHVASLSTFLATSQEGSPHD